MSIQVFEYKDHKEQPEQKTITERSDPDLATDITEVLENMIKNENMDHKKKEEIFKDIINNIEWFHDRNEIIED